MGERQIVQVHLTMLDDLDTQSIVKQLNALGRLLGRGHWRKLTDSSLSRGIATNNVRLYVVADGPGLGQIYSMATIAFYTLPSGAVVHVHDLVLGPAGEFRDVDLLLTEAEQKAAQIHARDIMIHCRGTQIAAQEGARRKGFQVLPDRRTYIKTLPAGS